MAKSALTLHHSCLSSDNLAAMQSEEGSTKGKESNEEPQTWRDFTTTPIALYLGNSMYS